MRPICLFTDFGTTGPYVGQVKAALHVHAPGVPVIDLMADAPAFDPMASAYLLAALLPQMPADAVIMAVVDPGVGGARLPLIVQVDGRFLVGPDNGLLALVLRRAVNSRVWAITWRPQTLSATFHGRDLFAPVAAALAAGTRPDDLAAPLSQGMVGGDWPDDLARIVYIDPYGNAMTGLRESCVLADQFLHVGNYALPPARTYSDTVPGAGFWYVNSIGLVEISVNRGHAARQLTLNVGDVVVWGEKNVSI
ncbi:conserved protein of unknown function [Magnetospirillum gryphiswaldense MSR-1 v2]|uniref:Protein containing DUF62 n=1 Tax=Magnetospirillum gryphiswaldense (strain DSM 6361 / JCM 21280 / NBRC 15271 / MSR-1) TaxID=431944 RepID=V6EY94_MAGGM|nr:SAM-dependent chlorinase/fluorinase [Magnetospirillum gryphiswaldense]CDK98225.1 conserved protein of unknown function [Magnetospirillum gryphiswaldense MSR-1 v2]